MSKYNGTLSNIKLTEIVAELTTLGETVLHSDISSSVTDESAHGEMETVRRAGKAASVIVDSPLLADETDMDDSVGDLGGGGG